jgi:CheY-like chemotaxis protein
MKEAPVANKSRVLVVEDNDADVFLLREAISSYNLCVELQVIENGALAIAYIEGTDEDPAAQAPNLCLLDMNLPLKGGTEVLQCLRKSKKLADVPAIVMTSSKSKDEREEILRLGASAYFHKPINYGEFMNIGELMSSFLKGNSEASKPAREA